MKRTTLSACAALLGLVLAPFTHAQMSGNNMLFNPTGNLSTGTQNPHVGVVGGIFLSTYSTWPAVNWLGYYDKDGDGLQNSHEVSLWIQGGAGGSSATPVASVTIPAGTAAPLVNGYRWVQLPSEVGLWYGSWYVLAATTDGVDTWGDMIDADAGELTWDSNYVGSNEAWSRAGRYDWSWMWPNPPSGQSGDNAIYPAANMGYNIVVPEPTSLSLLTLGAVAIWHRARNRKA